MILKLLSTQVPQFWEAIKWTATYNEGIEEPYVIEFTNRLLQSLLSDTTQCFMQLGEGRELLGMALTRIAMDKFGTKKTFIIQNLHIKDADKKLWKEFYDYIVRYARELGCSHIGLDTTDKKIWENSNRFGLEEYRRYYISRI